MRPPRIPWVLGPDRDGVMVAITGDRIAYAGPPPAPKLTGAEFFCAPRGKLHPGAVSLPHPPDHWLGEGALEGELGRGIATVLAVWPLMRSDVQVLERFLNLLLGVRLRGLLLFTAASPVDCDPGLRSALIRPGNSLLRAGWMLPPANPESPLSEDEHGTPIYVPSDCDTVASRAEMASRAFGRRFGGLEVDAVGDVWIEEESGLGPAWVAGEPVFRPLGSGDSGRI